MRINEREMKFKILVRGGCRFNNLEYLGKEFEFCFKN